MTILQQTRETDSIYVVDNASTDGSLQWLRDWLPENIPYADLIELPDNLGGAGGFAKGMQVAMDSDVDWIWMMDDDAEPHPQALGELIKIADNPSNIYGSLAVKGNDTSWTTTLLDQNRCSVDKAADVPVKARVESLPFLGFMIHRDLIARIGFPDTGYFIAADDVEYCVRAMRAGAELYIAGNSRIEHPKTLTNVIRIFGKNIVYLRLSPWKRYYDTRNRLLIARKYYGIKLLTQTIPGSFVRLIAALIYEPHKLAQLWAFFAGMTDGLLGRKGRRHAKWGLSQ